MSRLREALLWVGAALGLLAIATGVAVTFFGFSFLIFRSGSMEPAISTGAVALSRAVEARDIETGDVVSVVAGNGERITHRVVSSTLRGDEATLVMRGDANAVEDSELYVVTSAERVVADLPWGGYVLAHALTPPGLVAVACLSLMLLISGFSRVDDDEDLDDEDLGNGGPGEAVGGGRDVVDLPGGKHRGVGRFALASVVVLAMVGSTSGTLAAFTDVASAQTSTFDAASIATPVTPTVSRGTTNAVISWSATSVGPSNLKATSYDVLRYTSATGGTPTVLCPGTTALTCSDPSPGSATVYYSIRARYGSLWQREGQRASFLLGPANSPPSSFSCFDPGALVGDAYVRWTAPVGTSPTGYRLTYRIDGVLYETRPVGSDVRQDRPAVQPSGNRIIDATIAAIYAAGDSTTVSTVIRWDQSNKRWAC